MGESEQQKSTSRSSAKWDYHRAIAEWTITSRARETIRLRTSRVDYHWAGKYVDYHLECRHAILGDLEIVSGGHLWLQPAERARSEAKCERPVGSLAVRCWLGLVGIGRWLELGGCRNPCPHKLVGSPEAMSLYTMTIHLWETYTRAVTFCEVVQLRQRRR